MMWKLVLGRKTISGWPRGIWWSRLRSSMFSRSKLTPWFRFFWMNSSWDWADFSKHPRDGTMGSILNFLGFLFCISQHFMSVVHTLYRYPEFSFVWESSFSWGSPINIPTKMINPTEISNTLNRPETKENNRKQSTNRAQKNEIKRTSQTATFHITIHVLKRR